MGESTAFSTSPWQHELAVAEAAARAAGAVLLSWLGQVREVRFKGTVDPVTEADRASETLLREQLLAAFPADAILGEEQGGEVPPSGRLWVIDPLDGTVNFVHTYPVFCVSVALCVDLQPVVGVIYDPTRDECFRAVRDAGADLNGVPLQVSQIDALLGAVLATGFPYDLESRMQSLPLIAAFLNATQGIRRGGAAALDLAYSACGRLDGYWEREVQPWDLAAGVLLVQEAGGTVSDYTGEALSLFGQEVVVSNGALHAAMLDVIATLAQAAGDGAFPR